MSLFLTVIEEVDSAPLLTDTLALAAADSSIKICDWVLNEDVPDDEAAPILTLAVEYVGAILARARAQLSHELSESTIGQLTLGLESLQSFLLEDVESPANVDDIEKQSDDAAPGFAEPVDEPPITTREDYLLSTHIAAFHHRILAVVLILILALFTVFIVLVGRDAYDKEEEQHKKAKVMDLFDIGSLALDVVYDVASHDDNIHASVDLATQILNELSLTSTRSDSTNSPFVGSLYSLYEFRASTQDFASGGRVKEMLTSRRYGQLCKQNLSYPLQSPADSGIYVIEDLTPQQCADDSVATSCFRNLSPGYKTYLPGVETYRRNIARAVNGYHVDFAVSFAATLDHETLQEYATPRRNMFGFSNPLRSRYGEWKTFCATWLAITLGGFACLLLWLLEVFAAYDAGATRGGRLVASFAVGVLTAATLVACFYVVIGGFNREMDASSAYGAMALARCALAGITSPLFQSLDALPDFLDRLTSYPLNSKFLLWEAAAGAGTASPPSMAELAEKLDLRNNVAGRHAGAVLRATEDYVYAATYARDLHTFTVVVEERAKKWYPRGKATGLILGGALTSIFFTYVYLAYSPLHRLFRLSSGSPFLSRLLAASRHRYVLYAVISVTVIATEIGLSFYGISLVRQQYASISKETLMNVMDTRRLYPVEECLHADCGLPRFGETAVFTHKNDEEVCLTTNMPYPFPLIENQSDYGGTWATRYLGADLSLSTVSTVVENVPSFSTPLMNTSSGSIAPTFIERRTVVTVGDGGMTGYVMERKPESSYPSSYAFVALSVGIGLSVSLLYLGLGVMEWQYLSLSLRRHRQSTRRPVVVMIVTMLVIVSTFLISGGIMKPVMHHAFTQFIDDEMSFYLRSTVICIENAAYHAQYMAEDVLPWVSRALFSLSANLQEDSPFYSSIWLLSETKFGLRKLKFFGSFSSDPGASLDMEDWPGGLVPKCGELTHAQLDAARTSALSASGLTFPVGSYAKGIRYCVIEVSTSFLTESSFKPRAFAMMMRAKDEVITTPTSQAWTNLFLLSVAATGVVFLFLLLVMWWTLYAPHAVGFRPENGGPYISPLFGRVGDKTVDYFTSRSHRLLWMTMFLIIGGAFVYFGAEMSSSIEALTAADDMRVPYTTQEGLCSSLFMSVLGAGYNYISYPSSKVLEILEDTSTDALRGRTEYKFLNPKNRGVFAAIPNSIIALFATPANKNFADNSFVPLVDSGYKSYQSLIAVEYLTYMDYQTEVMESVSGLRRAVVSFVQSYRADLTQQFSEVLVDFATQLIQLNGAMQQLFVLDHVSLGAMVDFSSTPDDNVWPLGTPEDAAVLRVTAREAYRDLSRTITTLIDSIRDTVNAMYGIDGAQKSLFLSRLEIVATFAQGAALASPSAAIWTTQQRRDATMNLLLDPSVSLSNKEAVLSMADTIDAMSDINVQPFYMSEMNLRKTTQMSANRKSFSAAHEKPSTGWEIKSDLVQVSYRMVAAFAVTAVVTMSIACGSAVCIVLMRKPIMNADLEATQGLLKDTPAARRARVSSPARVIVFLIFGCAVALLPLMGILLMNVKTVHASNQDLDAWAMSKHVVSQEQQFVGEALRLPTAAAKSYAAGDASYLNNELEDFKRRAAYLMVYVLFAWRETMTVYYDDNLRPTLGQSSIDKLESVLDTENQLRLATTQLIELYELEQRIHDQAFAPRDPLPADEYGRIPVSMLGALSSTDSYAILLEGGYVPGTSMGQCIDEVLSSARQSLTTDPAVNYDTLTNIFTILQEVNDVGYAHLNTWYAFNGAAKSDGYEDAIAYAKYTQLVGPTALTALAATGNQYTTAAIAEINAVFDSFLTNAATEEDVKKIFTGDFVPAPGESDLFQAYVAAGQLAGDLTDSILEPTFRALFAYNRGFLDKPPNGMNVPSIAKVTDNLIQLAGKTIGSEQVIPFRIHLANVNTFIWYTEALADESPTNVSSRFYMMEWCLIFSFWILLLVAIYMAFSLYLL